MRMQQSLNAISKWGKFLGYTFIVLGAISALAGVFAFLVGAIPGVITIFLGLYLLRSAKEAEILLGQEDEGALVNMVDNYAKYLKLQGIFLLIYLILAVVMIVLSITGAIFFGEYIDSLNNY